MIWHNIHHVWYVGDKLNYRLLNLIIYFFQLGCIPKDNRTLSLSQCLNEHNNLETWNVNTISLINCSVWSTSSNQSIQITFQWVHTAKSPQWQTKWKKYCLWFEQQHYHLKLQYIIIYSLLLIISNQPMVSLIYHIFKHVAIYIIFWKKYLLCF